MSALDPAARDVIAEEEALLVRVLDAVARASAKTVNRGGELRSVEALRALRDEAVEAREDDLPAMLQEMSVRQRLVQRQAVELPDADSPYLAHLRLEENGRVRDYLLGRATFLDAKAEVRIVDWRVAPIAQIFYRYREGDDFEEMLPGRLAEGRVLLRRVLVIEKGVLRRIVGDGIALTRAANGEWQSIGRGTMSFASGGAGTAARPGELGLGIGAADRAGSPEVTALLDREQFAAIDAPPGKPLLVLGSAGSGKTTVALHRLTRIAARDPEGYPLSRMQVVVPEEGLARLSRRLLDGLGATEAAVRNLDEWSIAVSREVFEKRPRLSTDTPPLVSSLKRHPAMYRALQARYAERPPSGFTQAVLRRWLAEAFSDRGFLQGVVDAAEGTLRRTAIEETVRYTMLQIARPLEKELGIVDAERREGLDGRGLSEGTPEELAATVDVDDLPILVCLRAWKRGIPAGGIAHLVLDEAEDFSLFELFVAGALLGTERSVTLAGDDAQQTTSSFGGWDVALETIGATGAERCRLAVSYRCPRPIAQLARTLLGSMAPDEGGVAREGAPVGHFRFPDEEHLHLFLAEALADLTGREPRASIAVICADADAARRTKRGLSEVPEARLVLDGEFIFDPGIDVTDVDSAKGLEFDYVVVPDATAAAYPEGDEARRRLHVAVTRASHQLWILAAGTPSPLLPDLEPTST